MADMAVFDDAKVAYLSGNRTAIKRSIVTMNMFVTEAIQEQCPIKFFTIKNAEFCCEIWLV